MLFSNCQGLPQTTNNSQISMHAPSSSSYQTGSHYQAHYAQGSSGNLLTSCMQVVCGVDTTNSASRLYSTTIEDNSSITANTHQHLNFSEDSCRITLNLFNKEINGRSVRFIQAKATLFDDEVDEAHDLFYLVKMPEHSNSGKKFSAKSSSAQISPTHTNLKQVAALSGALGKNQTKGASRKADNSNSRLFFPRQRNSFSASKQQNEMTLDDQQQTIEQPLTAAFNSLRQTGVQPNSTSSHQSQSQTATAAAASGFIVSGLQIKALKKSAAENTAKDTESFTFAATTVAGRNAVIGPTRSISSNHSAKSETGRQVAACEGDDLDYGVNGLALQSRQERCDTETVQRHWEDPVFDMIQQQSPARLMGKRSTCQKQPMDATVHHQLLKIADKAPCQPSSITSSQLFHSTDEIDEFAYPLRVLSPHGHQAGTRGHPRLPKTYGDLQAKYTIAIRRDKTSSGQNVAIGQFPISRVPDGNYRIYYFRPGNRNRMLGSKTRSSSARDKIQSVGRGQEFYIFDKNSSVSPSKQNSQANSQEYSFAINRQSVQKSIESDASRQLSSLIKKKSVKTQKQIASHANKQSSKHNFFGSAKSNGGSYLTKPIGGTAAFSSKLTTTPATTKLNTNSTQSLNNQHYRARSGGASKQDQATFPGSKATISYFATVNGPPGAESAITGLQAAHKARKVSSGSDNQLIGSSTNKNMNVVSSAVNTYQTPLTNNHKTSKSRSNFVGEVAVTQGAGSCDSVDRFVCQHGSQNSTSNSCITASVTNSQTCAGANLTTTQQRSDDSGKLQNSVALMTNHKRNAFQLVQNLGSQLKCDLNGPNPAHLATNRNNSNDRSVGVNPLGCSAPQCTSLNIDGPPDAINHFEAQNDSTGQVSNTMAPLFHTSGDMLDSMKGGGSSDADNYQGIACKNKIVVLQVKEVDKMIDRVISDFTPIESPLTKENIVGGGQNCAIRFEKQMSYSNNKQGSSSRPSSASITIEENRPSNLQHPDQTGSQERMSQNQQRQSQISRSAFDAAETTVRNSQIQMFSLADEAADKLMLTDECELNALIANENEVAVGLAASATTSPPPSNYEDLFKVLTLPQQSTYSQESAPARNGNYQISYLQQLLDTRGPNEELLGYPHAAQGLFEPNNMAESQGTTIQILSNDSDQMQYLHSHLGNSILNKHSQAVVLQDGGSAMMTSSDAPSSGNQYDSNQMNLQHPNELEYYQNLEQQCYLQSSEGFGSPSKSTYQDLIKQANTQNNQGTNFDQLTRNSADCKQLRSATYGVSASDRKQLSTVEEENPSQCSDMISIQHHQQNGQTGSNKFRIQSSATQLSGFSKKSLRSTAQPIQNVPVPKSFCINDDNILTEQTDVQKDDDDPCWTHYSASKAQRNIEVQDIDTEEKQQISIQQPGVKLEPFMKLHGQIANEEVVYSQALPGTTTSDKGVALPYSSQSTFSTKTCSKQASDAAIGTGLLTKENQVLSGIQSLKIADGTTPEKTTDYHNCLSSHSKDSVYSSRAVKKQDLEEQSSNSLLDLENNHIGIQDLSSKVGCILAQIGLNEQSQNSQLRNGDNQFFMLSDGKHRSDLHFDSLNHVLSEQHNQSKAKNFDVDSEENNKDDSAVLMKFIEKISTATADHEQHCNMNLFQDSISPQVSQQSLANIFKGTKTAKNSIASSKMTVQGTTKFQLSEKNSNSQAPTLSRVSLASKQVYSPQKLTKLQQQQPVSSACSIMSGRNSKTNVSKNAKKSQKKAGSTVKTKQGAKPLVSNELHLLHLESCKENWKLSLSPILQSKQLANARSRQPQQSNLTPLLSKPAMSNYNHNTVKSPSKLFQLVSTSVASPQPSITKVKKQQQFDTAFMSGGHQTVLQEISTKTFEPVSSTNQVLQQAMSIGSGSFTSKNSSTTMSPKPQQQKQPLLKQKDVFSSKKKELATQASAQSNKASQPKFLQLKVTQTQLIKTSVTASNSNGNKRAVDATPYQSWQKKAPVLAKSVSALSPTLAKVMQNNFMQHATTETARPDQ